MPEFPSGRSPRREVQLHGPRPTPLRVSKDSHKIRKPPTDAPAQHHPHAPPRPPVIIYTVSPKIIHVDPNEFMSLVQRLTGLNSSCTSSTLNNSPSNSACQEKGGAISPAARLASIEKTKSCPRTQTQAFHQSMEIIEGIEIGAEIQRTGQFPGVLSPNPNTLLPIPPNFFSTPSDSNPLNFFHDLSPVLHSNRNLNQLENSFIMPSPNTLDLFNTLFDL